MNLIKHIIIVFLSLFIMLGVPFLTSPFFQTLVSGEDAVSSASVALDEPSGKFVVFINKDMHPDEDNLKTWICFFKGEEISFLFEDIRAYVAKGDEQGETMAESFMSHLPENQMKVYIKEATMMLSKAEAKRFDIIIMSKEYYDMYGAKTLEGIDGIIKIDVSETEGIK